LEAGFGIEPASTALQATNKSHEINGLTQFLFRHYRKNIPYFMRFPEAWRKTILRSRIFHLGNYQHTLPKYGDHCALIATDICSLTCNNHELISLILTVSAS
jgi:hypothetical protein